MTGAHRDSFRVENGAEIVRVDALDRERDHRGLLRRRADDDQSRYTLEFFGRQREQTLLVCVDVVDAKRIDVIDCSREADRSGNIGSPGLELEWQLVVSGLLEAHG